MKKNRDSLFILFFPVLIFLLFFLVSLILPNFFGLLTAGLISFFLIGFYLGLYQAKRQAVKIEEAFQESQGRLRGIFEAAQNVSFIITDGKDPEPLVLEFSPGAEKIFGYTREEMIGKKVSILHLPQDVAKFPEAHRIMKEGKRGFGGVTTLIRKNGEKFSALFSTYPLFDNNGQMYGALGVSIDINDQKKAEEALKGSRNYLDKIINSIADPIFVKDRQHRWVLLNDAHTQMFGIPKEEMLGKSDHDYFPKKEADIFWEKDELVFEGGQENINTELWTDAKGIIHTIVTKKTLYADAKGNKFIVGIIRDISEIVKIQEKLKEAMEVKSNFTSMVSHELRTPLAAIKTGVKLVLDGLAGEVNSEQRDFLSIVKNNVDRLDRLINNVLDLQKLEAGKIQFNITPNDINEVAREIYLTMLPVAKEKGLEFKLQLDAAPVSVQFDRDSITQVLTNLFNNAFKFTENGGVTITVSHDDNFIQVVVSDTGLGIKKEDIPKLFHAFEQLDRKRGRKIEGSGLGLAICKEIIEKHRGMIWVESELGKGSIFYFTLPR
jgi:PAS domain S-box-containing protein